MKLVAAVFLAGSLLAPATRAADAVDPELRKELAARLAETLEAWSSRDERRIDALYLPGAERVFFGLYLAGEQSPESHVKALLDSVRDWQRCAFVPLGEPWFVPGSEMSIGATRFRLEGATADGEQRWFEGRWSLVWKHEGGRWLIAHEHISFTVFPTPPKLPGPIDKFLSSAPVTGAKQAISSLWQRVVRVRLPAFDLGGLLPQSWTSAVLALALVISLLYLRRWLAEDALDRAAAANRPRLVGLLTRLSGRADRADHWGRTALMRAAENGASEACRRLLAAGASVAARDRTRATALHYAADSGDLETVMALLDHGADPNAGTPAGETAADVARASGHLELERLLRSREEAAWTLAGSRPPAPSIPARPQASFDCACPKCGVEGRLVLSHSRTRTEDVVRRFAPWDYARCRACRWRGRVSKRRVRSSENAGVASGS